MPDARPTTTPFEVGYPRMMVMLDEWQMVTLLENIADACERSFEQDAVYQVRIQTLYDHLQGVYDTFLVSQGRKI